MRTNLHPTDETHNPASLDLRREMREPYDLFRSFGLIRALAIMKAIVAYFWKKQRRYEWLIGSASQQARILTASVLNTKISRKSYLLLRSLRRPAKVYFLFFKNYSDWPRLTLAFSLLAEPTFPPCFARVNRTAGLVMGKIVPKICQLQKMASSVIFCPVRYIRWWRFNYSWPPRILES
jgi:hypothetical protein